jgi:hypothetical protein
MALRLSTGLRQALLGKIPARSAVTVYTATTIAAVDGGGSDDTLTDTANGFLTEGFAVGDSVLMLGFTGANAGCVGPVELTAVAAGTLTFATGSLTASDAEGESITLVAIRGGAFRDIFKHSVLEIYSGTQPATADAAETGTKLLRVTISSGAFTPASPTNGLLFGAPVSGVISKAADVWSGVGLAAGTAGWWRLYDNAYTTGLSTSGIRIDGNCATSGGDLTMASLSITLGATTTIDSFAITQPAA